MALLFGGSGTKQKSSTADDKNLASVGKQISVFIARGAMPLQSLVFGTALVGMGLTGNPDLSNITNVSVPVAHVRDALVKATGKSGYAEDTKNPYGWFYDATTGVALNIVPTGQVSATSDPM